MSAMHADEAISHSGSQGSEGGELAVVLPAATPGGYDPDLLTPGIATSDDVIEFYGKYGQDR